MKSYNIDDIKRIPIADYLASQGVEVKHGRCKAVWHKSGGDNAQAVSIDAKKNLWHDFVEGRGGSVIDLCMLVEGKTLREAIGALAERYNITATDGTKTNNPKPKRKVEPNWVNIAAAIRELDTHLLTSEDRYWFNIISLLLVDPRRDYEVEEVFKVAIELLHAKKTKDLDNGKED